MIYQTRFKDTFLLLLAKELCYKKTFKYPFKSGLTLEQRLAKKIHKLVKLGSHERILEAAQVCGLEALELKQRRPILLFEVGRCLRFRFQA